VARIKQGRYTQGLVNQQIYHLKGNPASKNETLNIDVAGENAADTHASEQLERNKDFSSDSSPAEPVCYIALALSLALSSQQTRLLA
jgi:hypothetical protein